MRPRSKAVLAASRAALGAGAEGWPTSMWTTLSPRLSLAAAALSTSMARKDETRSRRRATRGERRSTGDLVISARTLSGRRPQGASLPAPVPFPPASAKRLNDIRQDPRRHPADTVGSDRQAAGEERG